MLAAETGAHRFTVGAYSAWRAHVGAVLTEAGVGGVRRDALVDVLLAPLAPELYRYRRHELGLTRADVHDALRQLATSVLTTWQGWRP